MRRNLILNALAAAVLCLANAAPAAGSRHVWYDGHYPVTFWVSADAPLVVQTAWSRCAADAKAEAGIVIMDAGRDAEAAGPHAPSASAPAKHGARPATPPTAGSICSLSGIKKGG